jgi:hypothetical protein
MKRTLLSLATVRTLSMASAAALVALASVGCGASAPSAAKAPSGGTVVGAALAEAKSQAITAPATLEDETTDGPLGRRAAGDYVVYRFSGSFRKTPALLTEKVVTREGGLFVIDYTLVDGKKSNTLRVHLNGGAGARVEVLEVESVVDGVTNPALPVDFDAMMSKTILSVDANDGTEGTEAVTLDVGGKPLVCERTTYLVTVGKHAAKMIVTRSDGFVWGDVAAEITTTKGEVLYRAEVLEAGRETTGSGPIAAK